MSFLGSYLKICHSKSYILEKDCIQNIAFNVKAESQSGATLMSSTFHIDPTCAAVVEEHGGLIAPLSPIGVKVEGIDLSAEKPPEIVIKAFELRLFDNGYCIANKTTDKVLGKWSHIHLLNREM